MFDVVVETTFGRVEGAREGNICIFRGIPYAAPPVGERRFRPPNPPEAWTGVREAKPFGPAAPQLPSPLKDLLQSPDLEMSEDCLYLNVYTPEIDDGRRPVMVWIHGGAFTTGAGSLPWYDGTSFATRGDVVLVTINYRLGALGFMYLDELVPDLEGTANLGILDQIAALEWVQNNIAAFGGDPSQVTVFGESAGGMSVGTLMGLPAAKGLFSRATLQSGAVRHISDADEATGIAREILETAGVANPSAEALRAIDTERLLAAQGEVVLRHWGRVKGLPLQPVLDGHVIPSHPLDAIEGGSSSDLDVLTGTTRDEMLLFALLDPDHQTLDESKLLERATRVFGSEEAGRSAIETYAATRPDATPGMLWSAIATDLTFRIPSIDLIERHRGNCFVYLFAFCTPVMDGRLGSCHALEIPFVFNNLDAPGVERFAGPVTPHMRELALAMHEAWFTFARTGRPRSDLLPQWPPYEPDGRRTMIFGDECSVVDDPFSDERRLWQRS
jgi:para-nitrobenzyl esterase